MGRTLLQMRIDDQNEERVYQEQTCGEVLCCKKKRSILKKKPKVEKADDEFYPNEFDPYDYEIPEEEVPDQVDKTRDEDGQLERTQPMILAKPEVNPLLEASAETR
jgi:hypothetical protein